MIKGPEDDITDIKHLLLAVISSCAVHDTPRAGSFSQKRMYTKLHTLNRQHINSPQNWFFQYQQDEPLHTRNLFYPKYASHQDKILPKLKEHTFFF